MESLPHQSATEKHVDKQIENWKKSPVVVASGSTLRKNRLEEFGFQNVTAADSIPDALETHVASILSEHDGAPGTHWDKDGARMSEFIAAAKVDYVLKHQPVEPEAMVVGFDTTAVIYDSASLEKIMGVPRSNEKFSTWEEAQVGITEQFMSVAAGCRHLQQKRAEFEQSLSQHDWSEEDIEMTLNGYTMGLRQGYIHINTGVAAAFAHEHTDTDPIQRWTQEIKLFSRSLYAARENPQAVEKLVELVMETLGEKVLQISGGVDYADSHVRDILQLTEKSLADATAQEEVYKGFSEAALTVLLRMKAGEVVAAQE